MSMPFPAFALIGEPHTGRAPRVQRVRVVEIYALLGSACVHDVGEDGLNTGRSRILPLSRVASLKTLAAKTALFSAPESRPPQPHRGPGQTPIGTTDSGAANSTANPQTAPTTA